jgi:hypothetical protein
LYYNYYPKEFLNLFEFICQKEAIEEAVHKDAEAKAKQANNKAR